MHIVNSEYHSEHTNQKIQRSKILQPVTSSFLNPLNDFTCAFSLPGHKSGSLRLRRISETRSRGVI